VNKFSNIQLLTGAILLFTCLRVNAIPSITGEMGMIGNFIAVDSNWLSTSAAAATGVDFNPNLFAIINPTGSFTGLSGIGNIKDFQFDPQLGINDGLNGITAVGSIAEFWTIGGFSFELTSVSRGLTNDPDTFLILQGTGIISASGYLDTPGLWEFSGNTTNSQGSGTFSWSAGSASIPEPGMLALLGIGLIGFAGHKNRTITRADAKKCEQKLEEKGADHE